MGVRYTDPDHVRRQYGRLDPLAVRIETHLRYGRRRDSLAGWVLERFGARSGERVADVCCGPGFLYQPALRALGVEVVGLDLSPAMLARAAESSLVLRADAQALPLADGIFDRTMCNHALYHVPDQLAALRELRRVTTPGGRIVITTNSARTMSAFRSVVSEAAAELGLSDPHQRLPFALEYVDRVREVLPEVAVEEYVNELRFPAVAPAMAYISSSNDLPPPLLDAVESRIGRVIEREGAFTVETVAGCFVADLEA
ncbi:MAG TPA: methyltransferase domain-containing protein [Candidatus Dormibacteraeota bacterium]|nr:methyltransferase domain-containing protein [Candidatus Dormibacteraeota bacterium]